LFLVILYNGSISQETGSTLRGTITDDKGAFIPNVTITVKHEPTGLQHLDKQTTKVLMLFLI